MRGILATASGHHITLASEEVTVTVGHRDVLCCPPSSVQPPCTPTYPNMKFTIKLLFLLALLLPLVSARAALVRRAADPPKAEEIEKEAEVLDGKKEVLKTNEAFYYYYGYPAAYPYYGYGYPFWYYPYATYPVVYI